MATKETLPESILDLIDQTTIISLISTVAILLLAYISSLILLPSRSPLTTTKLRGIFIWHTFDTLIHFLLEGPFVYHSLFSVASPAQILSHPDSAFLQRAHWTIAGADFSTHPTALLWQEYAKADRRWGWGDPTTLSIEFITVVGAGTLAGYICVLIIRLANLELGPSPRQISARKKAEGKLWFWIIVLATMELYGGWMTFAPEWFSGSYHLNTSNWMYTWLYLFFFNTVWVWIPGWLVYEGYQGLMRGLGNLEKKTV